MGGCIFCLRLIAEHSDHLVSLVIEVDSLDSGSRTAHRTHIAFIEPHATSLFPGNENLAAAAGKCHIEQLIPFLDGEGNDTVCTRSGVSLKSSLLDDAVLRAEHHIIVVHIVLVLEVADVQIGLDPVLCGEVEDVLDCSALRCT